MAHFLKSDSDPSDVWAETATLCFPELNRIDSCGRNTFDKPACTSGHGNRTAL
jgi:hypothetical protein